MGWRLGELVGMRLIIIRLFWYTRYTALSIYVYFARITLSGRFTVSYRCIHATMAAARWRSGAATLWLGGQNNIALSNRTVHIEYRHFRAAF